MIVAVVVVVVLFAMALGGIALYVHKLLSSPHSSHKHPFPTHTSAEADHDNLHRHWAALVERGVSSYIFIGCQQ